MEYHGLVAATIVKRRTIWNRTGAGKGAGGSTGTRITADQAAQGANGAARAVFGRLCNLQQRLWTQIRG